MGYNSRHPATPLFQESPAQRTRAPMVRYACTAGGAGVAREMRSWPDRFNGAAHEAAGETLPPSIGSSPAGKGRVDLLIR